MASDKFDDEKQKAQDQPDHPTTEGKAEREHTRPPMVRCYAVFNVAQADGLKLERKGDDREHEPEWKRPIRPAVQGARVIVVQLSESGRSARRPCARRPRVLQPPVRHRRAKDATTQVL